MVRYCKKRGGSGYKKIKTSKGGVYKSVHPNRKTRAMRNYNQSKSKTTSKKSLTHKPLRKGTGHWLSFGKGTYNSKRQGYMKKLEKALPPQHYMLNTVVQLIPTAGLQVGGNLCSAYSVYDVIQQGMSTLDSDVGNASPVKVIFKDYQYNIMMTNNSNAPVFIDLYDCVCRRDTIDHTTANSTPYGSWSTDNSASVGATTYYGATPFQSAFFCAYWKVTGVTRLNLSLGETAEHVVKGKLNKVWNHAIDGQLYNSLGAVPTSLQASLKGLTTYTMAVIKGCPTDAANAVVGSSAAKIDFISTIKYTWCQVTTQAAGYSNIASTIATVAGDIMDTGTGASAAVTSA